MTTLAPRARRRYEDGMRESMDKISLGQRGARWLVLALMAPTLILGQPGSAVRAAPPARPAATAGWQPLPHKGLNGIVSALATMGDDVYVGGFFTATADGQVPDLNGIALLHNGLWQALP